MSSHYKTLLFSHSRAFVMKQHCKKWWVWMTPNAAESAHEVTVKHSRCLKVQTGWVKKKKKKIQSEATKVLRAKRTEFNNIHLSGFLHRHEMSISLQHTFICLRGWARLGPTLEQVHRWPWLVKLSDGKRKSAWPGMAWFESAQPKVLVRNRNWTLNKGVRCYFHSVMLENTQEPQE